MELGDIDKRRNQIVVRLKGARDEHRVPITDDFWPLYEQYIRDERRTSIDVNAVWIAARKGSGKPLRYASFESAIRYIGEQCGVRATPHMFRHTMAQGVLDITGNMKVAQELLGHANITTTADLYTHADQSSLVRAVAALKSAHTAAKCASVDPAQTRYAFAYDQETIDEFERVINAQPIMLQQPVDKLES
jgi:integrase